MTLESSRRSFAVRRAGHEGRIDTSLSLLLGIQCLTLFVLIPLNATHSYAPLFLDLCHLGFAGICVTMLTKTRAVQLSLLAALMVLAVAPIVGRQATFMGINGTMLHVSVAAVAFGFNGVVTILIARHVFAPGHVSFQRVQGAVLLYLNVAALFAIAYGAILSYLPGSIVEVVVSHLLMSPGRRTAEMTYFSLTTITTTGYGDFAPVHPLARGLANLEAVFGQLFPATLLARMVALHLAHNSAVKPAPPASEAIAPLDAPKDSE